MQAYENNMPKVCGITDPKIHNVFYIKDASPIIVHFYVILFR